MPLGQDDRSKIGERTQPRRISLVRCDHDRAWRQGRCLLSGLLVGVIFLSGLRPGLLGVLIGFGGGGAIGVILNLLPELVVAQLAKRRVWQLHAALPDALDLLIVCLEAGLTFERALRRTITDLKTFQPSLAAELGEASVDMNVHGRSREDALGRVAARWKARTSAIWPPRWRRANDTARLLRIRCASWRNPCEWRPSRARKRKWRACRPC